MTWPNEETTPLNMIAAGAYLRPITFWATVASALVTFCLIIVALVSTLFFGLAPASSMTQGLLLALAFVFWTQCPYLLFVWLLRRREVSPVRVLLAAIGGALMVGWSDVVLLNAFFFHPDPQSALVLLYLPVPQWIGATITLLADAAVRHLERRKSEPPGWPPLQTQVSVLALAVVVMPGGWWLIQRPSNDRDWVPNLARLPHCTFQGDRVTVHSVRNTTYRSKNDYTPAYDDRTFDLRQIRSVDFLVVPFQGLEAAAHTLLIFGFDDGQRLAISVEVRRERGEAYSPLRGLLRQCELMYVIADERDVILLRTQHRRDKVYLYPIQATPESIRRMFASMLNRANSVREQPEFYNTLTNNCSSNILRHFNHINQRKLPASLKVLLPGYSDQLVYDLGLLDRELPFATLRRQSEISQHANLHADAPDFSRQIRAAAKPP